MAENEQSFSIRTVESAQNFIKDKYEDTIGLATSILGQVTLSVDILFSFYVSRAI